MVDVANVRRVADAIERHEIKDLGFNMEDWVSFSSFDKSGHNCGTTACIAGYAVAVIDGMPRMLALSIIDVDKKIDAFFGRAMDLFRMEEDDADLLMVYYRGDPTPAQAVRTLRHLANTFEATGQTEVRWDLPEAAP